ncbi:GNAT family N-acetyltransferase [Comamonas testosteroni]
MTSSSPFMAVARPEDAAECLRLRGLTRENAFTAADLQKLGITEQTWADGIRSGLLPGWIAWAQGRMAGYCFGNAESGEIMVLALLPQYEGRGWGRELLGCTVNTLHGLGWRRLFLACSSDPAVRSYGFYRHLGWVHTGECDDAGDHVLELLSTDAT